MPMNIFVPLLLLSGAAGMQELDEATSSWVATTHAEPRRCLIQQQKASAATLQMAESRGPETEPGAFAELVASGEDIISSQDIVDILDQIMQEQPAKEDQIQTRMLSEKKGDWTGKSVSISFASRDPDMQNVQTLTFNEYAAEDNKTLALAYNTTKTYMEMSFPNKEGSQIVSNSTLDKIYMYGFTAGTGGLKNSNANRVWYRHPSRKDAKLLYAFRMKEVPGDKEWKYSIEFTSSQPQALKTWPPGGKVAQIHNSIFVVMECPVPLECEDGKFTVSSVTFSPKSKDDQNAMKQPEDIVGKAAEYIYKYPVGIADF